MFISKPITKTEHKNSLPSIVGDQKIISNKFALTSDAKTSEELPSVQKACSMSVNNSKELAFRTKLKILKQRNKSWLSKGTNANQVPNENICDEMKNSSANTMKLESGNGIARLSDLLQENAKSASGERKDTMIRISSAKSRNEDSQSHTPVLRREKSCKVKLGDCVVTNGTTAPAPGMTTKQARDFLVVPGTSCLPERSHNSEDKTKEKLEPNLKLFEKLQHMIHKCEVTGGINGPFSVRPQSSPLQSQTIVKKFVNYGIKRCTESMTLDAKDKRDSELRTLSQKLLSRRNDSDKRHWPPMLDIVQLKVGGYSYKKQSSKCINNRKGKNSEGQDCNDSKPQSRREGVAVIIVPSHTTLDCPLCEVYYDENIGVEDENHFHHSEYSMHDEHTKRFNSAIAYRRTLSHQDRSQQQHLEHYQLPLKRFTSSTVRPKSAAEIIAKETPFAPHNQQHSNSYSTDSKRFPYFLRNRRSDSTVVPVPNI